MDEKHQQLLVNNVHTFDFKHDNQAFKFTTKEERDPQFLIQNCFVSCLCHGCYAGQQH
jgi:hypothetical protein